MTFNQWTWPLEMTEKTPVFVVTPENGFLPREDPILLPPEFKELSELLDQMSVFLPDGSPGLLQKGEFGAAAEKLPLYDVSMIEDQALLMALFRDYTYLASAYLLEPCDILNRQKGEYGRGRKVLCRSIAVPLTIISDKINAKPFMEYAQSYALYNYLRKNKEEPLEYDNLDLIRKFSGMKSEFGFIAIHVAMVRHSGKLVKAVMDILESASLNERSRFNESMSALVSVLQEINGVMEKMWSKSAPPDYMKFRTFIMGTKGQQEMFPDGVIYEGVDEQPRFYRGESGANDSIIPTCDNLLQLTWNMPRNPMTDILRDFRSYRPANHNEWLLWVDKSAQDVNLADYCEKDAVSLCFYIQLLDQVREFRHRHWLFAKEYIIKRTNHPVATGGSPMATWLPNQLNTVLQKIQDKTEVLNRLYLHERQSFDHERIKYINDRAAHEQGLLQKDVVAYKAKFASVKKETFGQKVWRIVTIPFNLFGACC